MLEFRILGPLEVVGDAGPVRLGGPKQRGTLAILLLSANRVVSVDRLADDLYAGAPPVTAVTQVQRQVSELRKALGDASVIETRAPGYVLRLLPEQLDLERFERRTAEAARALTAGHAEHAADLLHDALHLWRGAPLADLAFEAFAQTSIERLEEIRLAAIEQRIEADLAVGAHAGLVGELELLAGDYPLREGFRRQLMIALYRAGRQAEALDVYRRTRATLVKELGIEPGQALQELERAILRQDPELGLGRGRTLALAEPRRAVLVLPSRDERLPELLSVAEPLARVPGRELIVARLVETEEALSPAAAAVGAVRSSLGDRARTAAFTTAEPAREAVRLAAAHAVDLVLVDAPAGLAEKRLPADLRTVLERSPADVAVLAGGGELASGDVFVVFGGGEHDWAALELGGLLSSVLGVALRVVGTTAAPGRSRRDASRLIADASLALQRVVGVAAEPLLAESGEEELLAAVEPAALVIVGISPRWRREGLGSTRSMLVQHARAPVLLVHRGPRPGALAPRESNTRFSWSIGD